MDMCLKTAAVLEKEEIEQKRISYARLFWIFMLGSVVGFVLEGLWCIVLYGHWESHPATVWGPFCVIYGFGAAMLYLLAVMMEKKPVLLQFILCGLAGSVVELIGGVFQKACFGTSSWDYSHHALNIGGYISLNMTLMWGCLGILFVRFALPALEKVLRRMQGRKWQIACRVFSVYMAANLLVSCAALDRWQERHEGVEAGNAVESYLDTHYNDARMAQIYANMEFVE